MRKIKIICAALLIISALAFLLFHLMQLMTVDRNAPEIFMENERVVISVKDGEQAILSGITAQDKEDGDVTSTLLVEDLTCFDKNNVRQATIAAVDSAGNVSRVMRQVSYSDYEAPHFEISGSLRFQIGSDEVRSCVQAFDAQGKDISDQIETSTKEEVSAWESGEFPVTFTVTDDAGVTSSLTATVTLYEEENALAPTILLNEYLVYIPVGKQIDPWSYVEEVDVNEVQWRRTQTGVLKRTDSSEDVLQETDFQIRDEVDYQTPGCYEITYHYVNGDWDGTVRLVVVVQK